MRTAQFIDQGIQDYKVCLEDMQAFTSQRTEATQDQLWLVEHSSVYTLGLNGKREHLIDTNNIPVIQTDRGGQVTYHGKGQVIIYCLLDLKQLGLAVKSYVNLLERSIIELLNDYGLDGQRRNGAPGVYVNHKKISALGIRVKKGCCYHGLALNVDMDLAPFLGINPCGFAGLEVTQLSDFSIKEKCQSVAQKLLPKLAENLGLKIQMDQTKQTGQTKKDNKAA